MRRHELASVVHGAFVDLQRREVLLRVVDASRVCAPNSRLLPAARIANLNDRANGERLESIEIDLTSNLTRNGLIVANEFRSAQESA